VTPEEAEFVDRFGLFFERVGGTGTTGRLYGWLLICDPPQQSLTQLADTLAVSKASASTAARQLEEGGMVQRLPTAGRQHLYRVTPGGFTSVLNTQLDRMKLGFEAAEFGLSLLGDERKEQRERVEEFRDFCEFSMAYYRDEMMRRWTDYRAGRRQQA
jgi:DNA-binding MarR family transcriptional regulator